MLSLQKTNNINAILSSFHRAADQSVTNTRQKIAEDAKNRAPVVSGDLRDSIQATADGVEVISDHALWVELGTEHMSPQPFLTPSVQDAESDMISALQKALQ